MIWMVGQYGYEGWVNMGYKGWVNMCHEEWVNTCYEGWVNIANCIVEKNMTSFLISKSGSYSEVSFRGFFKPMRSNSTLTLALFKDLYTMRYATSPWS